MLRVRAKILVRVRVRVRVYVRVDKTEKDNSKTTEDNRKLASKTRKYRTCAAIVVEAHPPKSIKQVTLLL
jgi:hypothetical protein